MKKLKVFSFFCKKYLLHLILFIIYIIVFKVMSEQEEYLCEELQLLQYHIAVFIENSDIEGMIDYKDLYKDVTKLNDYICSLIKKLEEEES